MDNATLDQVLDDYTWRITHGSALKQAVADWYLDTHDSGSVSTGAIEHFLTVRAGYEYPRWERELGAPLTLRKLLQDSWPLSALPPDETADEIEPSTVTWLHTDVSQWPITSQLTAVEIREDTVCLRHTQAGKWPISTEVFPDGAEIEGNPWIFALFDDLWHGATWDWMRPGQECKSMTAVEFGRDQIRIPPMDSSWVPAKGDELGFMVSTIARTSLRVGEERSNIKLTTWPY